MVILIVVHLVINSHKINIKNVSLFLCSVFTLMDSFILDTT